MRFSGFSFSFVSYFMAAHIVDVDVTAMAILSRHFAISAAIIAHRLLRAQLVAMCDLSNAQEA
jgi:hypothetical protein